LSALRRDQEFEPLSLGGESHKLDHGDAAWLPGQQAAPHRRPSGSPKSKPISARNWKFESITLQHGVCCELAFRRAYH
jgi:hypothetical protein